MEGVVALLYPPECVVCGGRLSELGVVCAACEANLGRTEGPRCSRCGADLADPSIDLCLACGTRERGFDRIVAFGPYDGPLGDLVRAFKFDRELAVGRWLGARLAEAARRERLVGQIDWVTYVPMTRDERRARGFNQARVLAKGVARRLRIPVRRTLVKVRSTAGQAALPAAARRDNLRGAFRAIPSRGARVLLVDDICTTGSTAEECAKTLKRAGFSAVNLLIVARA